MQSISAIDFFCGGGGMTFGLSRAGIKVLAGVDIDISCKETYEFNNKDSHFINKDIKTMGIDFLESELGIKQLDDSMIFVGCSPCQYYSIINTDRTKSLKTKDLLTDFYNFVEYYKPGYVLVENVPGIVSNKSSVLPSFLNSLHKIGYNKIHKKVIDMSYYGVPQTRKRFSLIASRLEVDLKVPLKDEKQALLKDFIGKDKGFPTLHAGSRDNSPLNHSVAGLSEVCLKRLRMTPKNGGSRLAWKNLPDLQLPCFVGRDDIFVDTFGRMSWDKPASTITTKFYSISNGRFGHPEEDRALSIREGATLQTFPSNYEFKTKTISEAARIIGNAVPPEYARRVGVGILESLGTSR